MNRREFLATAAWLPSFLHPRKPSVRIAESRFAIVRSGRRHQRHFYWPHGDERTAREVLLEHLRTHSGTAVLTPSSLRTITCAGARLDPNRMFSREGAARNLRALNPEWEQARIGHVLDRLDRDRAKFLAVLLPPPSTLLIAMHNNSRGYSVEEEIPISDRTSLPLRGEPHEFMLCTDPRDFAVLERSPFNVVLEKDAPPADDGSLSRLAALRNQRYLNIEAAAGNADGQRRMLAWVEANLD